MKKIQLILLLSFFFIYNQGVAIAQDNKPSRQEMDAEFAAQWNKPEYEFAKTAAKSTYLKQNEQDVFYYLNLARLNPPLFAQTYVKQYNGEPTSDKGYAFDERKSSLITQMEQMQPLELLYPQREIYEIALCFATKSGQMGKMGHDRKGTNCENRFAECLAYGTDDGLFIVLDLLIDWGKNNEELGHRKICFANFGALGVSVQTHKSVKHLAVLNFGYGPHQSYTLASYTGQLSIDGKRNGKGTYTFPDGDVYEGEWVNGAMQGKGATKHADGSSYEGEWMNGLPNGMGTSIQADGSRYTGSWLKGNKDGSGILYQADGSKYDGSWKNGQMQGKGAFTQVDGSVYEGNWDNNQMNGKGIFYYSSGDRYEGDWNNGKMEGKGVYSYSNGDRYTGDWSNNSMNGEGIYFYANGDRYEGKWKNGERLEGGKYVMGSIGNKYK